MSKKAQEHWKDFYMKTFLKLFMIASVCTFFSVTSWALTPQEAACLELTSPSGLSAGELAPALGDLEPYAEDFAAAEREHGINAVFLASLAAFESGWGRYCIAENNIFGWSGPAFESKSECIDEIARRIKKNYLTQGGRYYRGSTLEGVNVCYNGSSQWLKGMSAMMAQIGTKAGCTAPEAEPEVRCMPYEDDLEMKAAWLKYEGEIDTTVSAA